MGRSAVLIQLPILLPRNSTDNLYKNLYLGLKQNWYGEINVLYRSIISDPTWHSKLIVPFPLLSYTISSLWEQFWFAVLAYLTKWQIR
jgi:hypothetical protein